MTVCPIDANLKSAFDQLVLVRKSPRPSSSRQLERYKAARLHFINDLKRFKANNPGFHAGPFLRFAFFLVRHNCYHPHMSGLTYLQVSNFVSGAIPSKVKELVCVLSRVSLKDAYSLMGTINSRPPYTPADYDVLHMFYC